MNFRKVLFPHVVVPTRYEVNVVGNSRAYESEAECPAAELLTAAKIERSDCDTTPIEPSDQMYRVLNRLFALFRFEQRILVVTIMSIQPLSTAPIPS